MDAKQYRAALEKLDLTQLAAGELFGVGARTSRRWALGEARVPPTVTMLLRIMVAKKMTFSLDIPLTDTRRVFTFKVSENSQPLR